MEPISHVTAKKPVLTEYSKEGTTSQLPTYAISTAVQGQMKSYGPFRIFIIDVDTAGVLVVE